jgi:hypothetical protein
MRYGLIDLLFLIACMATGMALGPAIVPDLPTPVRALAGPVSVVCLYLLLVYPFYRGLRLLPMILPRCPCCQAFQSGFHILSGPYPRITLRCPTCNGEFVIWYNGRPGGQETWEKPVLALKWPYALGRYCRLQKPEPDAPPNSRPPSQFPGSPAAQSSDSQRTSSSGGCG